MLDGALIDYAANVYDWGSVLPADYDSIAPTASPPAASNKRAAKPPSGQRANKQGRALPPPGSAFTGHTPIGLTPLPTAVAYEIPPQQRMYAAPIGREASSSLTTTATGCTASARLTNTSRRRDGRPR